MFQPDFLVISRSTEPRDRPAAPVFVEQRELALRHRGPRAGAWSTLLTPGRRRFTCLTTSSSFRPEGPKRWSSAASPNRWRDCSPPATGEAGCDPMNTRPNRRIVHRRRDARRADPESPKRRQTAIGPADATNGRRSAAPAPPTIRARRRAAPEDTGQFGAARWSIDQRDNPPNANHNQRSLARRAGQHRRATRAVPEMTSPADRAADSRIPPWTA